MKTNIAMTDFITFQNEIMKELRLLETKFTSEFNSKYSTINSGFEKLDSRINIISQNNNALLELITKQNMNYEKIVEFQSFKEKLEQASLTQDIKIKNIYKELDRIQIKYDKINEQNLLVASYIGPGCIYKNLSEYLQYDITEFKKLRNDTEQTKNKVDNAVKTSIDLLNNSLKKYEKYTDEKNMELRLLIDKKFIEFANKILEIYSELNRYQHVTDKEIKHIQNEIQKIIDRTKNDLGDKKINDINKKIKELSDEITSIKNHYKEINKKLKEIRQNNVGLEQMTMKSIKFKLTNNTIKNSNEIKFSNLKNKEGLKSSKNLVSLSDNIHKNFLISNPEVPDKNSDKEAPPRINNTSHKQEEKKVEVLSDKKENIDNNKEGKNNIENKQLLIEKKQDITSESKEIKEQKVKIDDNNLKKIEKNINSNSLDKSLEKNENENKKEKKYEILENSKGRNMSDKLLLKDYKLLSSKNIEIKEDLKLNREKNFFEDKETKKELDKEFSPKFISEKKENNKINIDKKISNKIKIDGIYKQNKFSKSNSLVGININTHNFIKLENDRNILSNNKIKLKDKILEDKKISTNSKEINNNKNNLSNDKNSSNKNDIKNLLNKINHNRNNIITKRNEDSLLSNQNSSSNKKLFSLQMNSQDEQNQIMKQIREYYNIKKLNYEKKSQQNVVDCNVINLNLRDLTDNISNRHKFSSAKNTFYFSPNSKINENRNSLREISMKLSPSFGRTNFRFSSRKNSLHNKKNFSSYDNIRSIKDTL